MIKEFMNKLFGVESVIVELPEDTLKQNKYTQAEVAEYIKDFVVKELGLTPSKIQVISEMQSTTINL